MDACTIATPTRYAAHDALWQAAYRERSRRSCYSGCHDGSHEADAASYASAVVRLHIQEAARLEPIGDTSSFTLWHHSTDSNLQYTNAGGYFDAAAAVLRSGDMIIINAPNGSAQATVRRSGPEGVEIGFLAAFQDAT